MIGNDLFVCNFYITVSDFLNTNINGHLTNTDFYSEHCYAIVCYVWKTLVDLKWYAEGFWRWNYNKNKFYFDYSRNDINSLIIFINLYNLTFHAVW
jgi:hypothetical protein